MPVIKVNDLQFPLHPGQNRLGGGNDVDVRVDGNAALGVQAVVDLADDDKAVIRRTADGASVRVNGIALVDPTPLLHGDKIEIGGQELFFAEDTKAGATAFVSAADVAAMALKRSGPARATAATGGRLVSLVDGKEYTVTGSAAISLGRDATCNVVVAQNEVSRKHAEVAPVEGGYEVRDFSANGVFVNGERVEGSRLLSRADIIRIGSEEFRFYADAATAPARSVTPPPPPPAPPVAAPVAPVSPSKPAAAKAPPPVDARPVLAHLEVTNEGPTKGQRYEIRVPLAHVGRGAHNDIVVSDESVSETHAKFNLRDDGWYLIDVDSTNGTYVGGNRLTTERKLEGAPDVRFGGVKMIFKPHEVAADTTKGTRAIAQIDRAKLRQTVPNSVAAVVSAAGPEPKARGIPVWVWVVAVLAIAAAGAFLLLKH